MDKNDLKAKINKMKNPLPVEANNSSIAHCFYQNMSVLMINKLGQEQSLQLGMIELHNDNAVLTQKGCDYCDEVFCATAADLMFEAPNRVNLAQSFYFIDDAVTKNNQAKIINKDAEFFVGAENLSQLEDKYKSLRVHPVVVSMINIGQCLENMQNNPTSSSLEMKTNFEQLKPIMANDTKKNGLWYVFHSISSAAKENPQNKELMSARKDCLLQLTKTRGDNDSIYKAHTLLGNICLKGNTNSETNAKSLLEAVDHYKEAWLALPKKDGRRKDAYNLYANAASMAEIPENQIFEETATKKEVKAIKILRQQGRVA